MYNLCRRLKIFPRQVGEDGPDQRILASNNPPSVFNLLDLIPVLLNSHQFDSWATGRSHKSFLRSLSQEPVRWSWSLNVGIWFADLKWKTLVIFTAGMFGLQRLPTDTYQYGSETVVSRCKQNVCVKGFGLVPVKPNQWRHFEELLHPNSSCVPHKRNNSKQKSLNP